MLKRSFDIVFAVVGLLLLIPLFILLAIWIQVGSAGGVFYRQVRVGKDGVDFYLLKFRTMHTGADRSGLLTIGGRDPRITAAGYFLRKYKLDELPQLWNVLKGEMSFVGPRPEVRTYVELYTPQQLLVLSVRPGITDPASMAYSNESDLLAGAIDPEKMYIQEVMPAKLKLNLAYIKQQGIGTDIRIIFQTIAKILR
jgi:lipopolysaccharide/colanic/teichoic acid biosynthesis glycosyltransferase